MERSTIFLMGKSTISMAMFNSKLLVITISLACLNFATPASPLTWPCWDQGMGCPCRESPMFDGELTIRYIFSTIVDG